MNKLFKLIAIGTIALSASTLFAQAPEGMNYQTVLRGSDGGVLSDDFVSMRFSIRTGSTSGSVVYQEDISTNTNEYGLVNHVIGEGNVLSGSFSSINWDTPTFLEVELNAGAGFVALGTTRLMSVPYALFAKEAEVANVANSLVGGNPTSYWSPSGSNIYSNVTGNVGIGTSSPIQKLDVGGRLNVNSGVIQRGTPAITATSDLGLYSQVSENWMRFVTNNAPINFYTQNGNGGIGSNLSLSIEYITPISTYYRITPISGECGLIPSLNNYGYIGSADARVYRVYAGTYYGATTSIQSLSDISLKQNIVPLSAGLDKLMLLKPVSYDFIGEKLYPDAKSLAKVDPKDLNNQIGFIAQEIDEVFPELTREVEKEDGTVLKTVGYAGLVPVLVKAIQEQQAQIDLLQAEIEALKSNE